MMEETKLNKIFYAVLGLMALGFFAISYDVDFYYDDILQVVQNPAIRNGLDLKSILNDQFRPSRVFLNITYAMNWSISQSRPWSYHLFNLLFHTLNTGLFFVFLKRIGVTNTLLRMFSGWLFFCHPLMVEGVSYVMGRTELLKTLVTMVLLLLYLRTPRPKFLIYVILIFSLLVKETCGLIPFLFIALDLTVGRLKWRELPVREHLFYLSHGLWMLLWWQFLSFDGMHGNLVGFNLYPFWDYLLTNVGYLMVTLKLFLLPTTLSILHEWPLQVPWLLTMLGAVVFVASLAYAHSVKHTKPFLAFMVVFFYANYLPNSSILQFINPYAEYRLYQSVMPLCVGLAYLLFTTKLRPQLSVLIASCFTLFFVFMHVLYVGLWHGPLAVWLNAQEQYPASMHLNTILAESYEKYGQCKEALKYWHNACDQELPDVIKLNCAKGLAPLYLRMHNLPAAHAQFMKLRQYKGAAPKERTTVRGLYIRATDEASIYRMLLLLAYDLKDQAAYRELQAEAAGQGFSELANLDLSKMSQLEPCRDI